MATRQYIGARYVPKFYQNSVDGSAQWESNVVYEPLTYVTLTNGHMYISKKQVPATVGSPVSNIDYWLDVGSYNGFIDQLQGEIDTINDVTIPALQASVTLKQDITDNNLATTDKTVVGAINEVNTAVGNINTNKQDKTDNNLNTTDKTVVGAINELVDDVQDIETDVTALKNKAKKQILVIGNSYVFFGVARKIEALFDAYYEKYESATGFITYADRTKTFVTELDDAIADTSIPKNEITDILFVSAMGDTQAYTEDSAFFQSNVRSAMTLIMSNIAINFPNCKNVMLTLAETRSVPYFTANRNKYNSLFQVHKIFKKLCYDLQINYLGWSGFNAMFNADYVKPDHYHPSDAGNNVIGQWMRDSYLGHKEYASLLARAPIDCAYVANTTVVCHVEVLPELVNIRFSNYNVPSGSDVAITANSALCTTADLDVPAPACVPGFSVEVDVSRISSGETDNKLFIGVEGDDNGIVQFNNYFAPQNATARAASLSLTGITNLSYIP